MLKKQNFSISKHINNNANKYATLVSSIAAATIFAPWWYPSGLVWDMDGNDIIQAAGQFATAGALVFGIWQYYQGKHNTRQSVLLEESKLLIQRLAPHLDPSRLKHEMEDFVAITEVMVRLVNLADHLEMLVDEIEPAQRFFLSIYWHELMYGPVTAFFSAIRYQTFVRFEDFESLSRIEGKMALEFPEYETNLRYLNYKRAVFVLDQPDVTNLLESTIKSKDVSGVFGFFKKSFHDKGLIDKLLLEEHLRPDMRVYAPFLAALYETMQKKQGKPPVNWNVE